MDTALTSLDLPIRFEPRSLKAQLAQIATEEWIPHHNERDYGGDWRGLSLRSLSGKPGDLRAHSEDSATFENTSLLERLPAFRAVMAAFECPLRSVRLLSLFPGSVILEHSDPDFGIDRGEIRIHIPIQTSSSVEFYLGGERLQLEEGHVYYIDAGKPHRVRNRGIDARIHLVLDAELNAWLKRILNDGGTVTRAAPPANGIDAFRAHVFSDASLQEELHAALSPAELKDRAAHRAREHGFDVEANDLVPALSQLDNPPAGGWLPTSVRFRDSQPVAEWAYAGRMRLAEPFFDDSIRIARRNPFARLFRCETPLPSPNGRPPAGFVFHMSRCGSTLVAQMFAALSRLVVLSEAPAIDEVIQAAGQSDVDVETRLQWVRSIVAALGRPRVGETDYIVKLESWHIHDLPLIRAAFPQTPWIFLYRNPIEVLVSQMRSPGRFVLPGAMPPSVLRMPTGVWDMPRDEWCVRILAGFCQAALLHRNEPGGLLVNYRELPAATWSRIARHFSISLEPEDLEILRAASLQDAKAPRVPFESDSHRKVAEATPEMAELVKNLIAPLYRELEGAEGGQGSPLSYHSGLAGEE